MINLGVGFLLGFTWGVLTAVCVGAWRRKTMIERRRQEFLAQLADSRLDRLVDLNDVFHERRLGYGRRNCKNTVH